MIRPTIAHNTPTSWTGQHRANRCADGVFTKHGRQIAYHIAHVYLSECGVKE